MRDARNQLRLRSRHRRPQRLDPTAIGDSPAKAVHARCPTCSIRHLKLKGKRHKSKHKNEAGTGTVFHHSLFYSSSSCCRTGRTCSSNLHPKQAILGQSAMGMFFRQPQQSVQQVGLVHHPSHGHPAKRGTSTLDSPLSMVRRPGSEPLHSMR